jgi:hypothetical protein
LYERDFDAAFEKSKGKYSKEQPGQHSAVLGHY